MGEGSARGWMSRFPSIYVGMSCRREGCIAYTTRDGSPARTLLYLPTYLSTVRRPGYWPGLGGEKSNEIRMGGTVCECE